MGKLTAMAVKAATKPGRYQDGDGLHLFVKGSGAQFWVLRIQVEGKRRDIGLGPASNVSLKDARNKAQDMRRSFRDGIDPVALRRAAKHQAATTPTFRKAAEMAHHELKDGWRNVKHRADWLSSLDSYAFPSLGNIRVDRIDAPVVRDALLPIWLERPETARRVRQRIKLVIDWATAKGFRTHLDLDGVTKALPRQPRSNSHFAAMPYEDVPVFMSSLRNAEETVSRLALQFLILNASRSGEVRGARFQEIDEEAKTWTIPGDRMKGGQPHVIPLSKPAIAIVKRARELRKSEVAFMFPGNEGKPLSDMTMLKILRDKNLKFTVHGFRSAFKTWAVEATGFPDAVSEAALAHIDANKVRAAYSRTDFREQRAALLAAWADFLADRSNVSWENQIATVES